MLSNLHTHTTFCDGRDTAEAVVLSAIDKGFCSLGFSGHAPTVPPCSCDIKDLAGYKAEILRLREKYKKDIEIYLGIEEDAVTPVNRSDFDYIIGSNHFYIIGGKFVSVDSTPENFKRCLELFGGNPLALAENYFEGFCRYIKARRPDIIGHFDLLTKFDENENSVFLANPAYHALAEKYLRQALSADCMFEVNTGAISRGWRTAPYPHEKLLHVMKKEGARLVLNADSHAADTIDCHFAESKALLRDIGFNYTYILYGGEFIKDYL